MDGPRLDTQDYQNKGKAYFRVWMELEKYDPATEDYEDHQAEPVPVAEFENQREAVKWMEGQAI